MNNLFNIVMTALLLIGASQVKAQSAEKRTILVNGQATEVMVTPEGDIQSSLRERPNYMAGYVQAPANLKRQASPTANPVMVEVENTSSQKKGDLIVSFENDQIVLTDASTTVLEGVVEKLKTAPKGFVLLRSKFDASSSASNVIAQRRVYSCKKYLETKGIAPNKILISLEPGDASSNDVNVFIR